MSSVWDIVPKNIEKPFLHSLGLKLDHLTLIAVYAEQRLVVLEGTGRVGCLAFFRGAKNNLIGENAEKFLTTEDMLISAALVFTKKREEFFSKINWTGGLNARASSKKRSKEMAKTSKT